MCLRMRAGSMSTLTATCLRREAMPVIDPPVAMVSWRRMPRRKSSARWAWVRKQTFWCGVRRRCGAASPGRPRLYEREVGLGVVEVVEVAFEAHGQFGLG